MLGQDAGSSQERCSSPPTPWTCSNGSTSILFWVPQAWKQGSREGSVKGDNPLPLLPPLFWCSPMVAFCAASIHCWFMSSFLSARTPNSSQRICSHALDVKEHSSQDRILADTTHCWPPPGHRAIDNNSLIPTIQPILHPPLSSTIMLVSV